ncbi:MAG: tRNA lysidine(34) synthetase TilS [Pseudohongiellaceae bacterium]
MKFTLQSLAAAVQSMPQSRSLVVAFSGGLDSSVLLHGLNQLRQQADFQWSLRALHINHGMQSNADNWERHCQRSCQELNIDLAVTDVRKDFGDSLPSADVENAARKVRYQAFEENLQAGEALLLAHQLDDQVETLLLRLMRGAGIKGLAGIPVTRALGQGFLYRPLLDFDRQQLAEYASTHALQWLQDESNEDEQFDRNFVRRTLLPSIALRWPGYRDSWSKTVTLAAESQGLLAELAAIDLNNMATEQHSVIWLEPLLGLSNPRQRNLLRHWLSKIGVPDLGWNRLQQLSKEVLRADVGSDASLLGEGLQLRCYKQKLYALKTIPEIDPADKLHWDTSQAQAIVLPRNGSLHMHPTTGSGIALLNGGRLQIHYRRGGESCQLAGRPNKSLKKLLQEHEIEPWLRKRMPLLYIEDVLACIPGVGVAERFTAKDDEPSLRISWRSPDFGVDRS